MRLLINTASTHKGGAVQVAWSFVTECINYSENEYLVILSPKLSNSIDIGAFPSNFQFVKLEKRAAQNIVKSVFSSNFDEIEEQFKPDVVFTTSGPAYWTPKVPHVVGFNLPHYIYPESPFFRNRALNSTLKWYFKGLLMRFIFKREADAVVCQTRDVSERVKSFLRIDNVYTVSNTFNKWFETENRPSIKLLPMPEGNEFRLLLLSSYHEHKNFEIIPKVINLLQKKGENDIKFILTIGEADFEKVFKSKTASMVLNIGNVEIDKCPQLYSEIDVMFLPSLLECFSASYPEAMISKRPIITSNLGFAQTVCDDAALYFDATNEFDIVKIILQVKNDINLQKRLIEKGIKKLPYFNNGRQRAMKFLDICESLIIKE